MEKIKKAGALIINNKKLLIVRPKEKLYFINPGGKYEGNESAEDCLGRELKEELQISLASFKHYKTYDISKAAHSNYPLLLELYLVEFKGNITPSSEIEVIEWLSQEDFKNRKYNLAPSFYKYIPDLINDGLL